MCCRIFWRIGLIMLLAGLALGCKKESKKKSSAPGAREGELVAGGLCGRGKRHGWRRLKVEYSDGAVGRLGCGEIHGKKESFAGSTVKPVAAVFVGKPGEIPAIPMKFYDGRGRMLYRKTLYPLSTAYLRAERFLVVVSMPPTLVERCIIRDVLKKRTLDFGCLTRPLFKSMRAAWLEWDEGKIRPTCVNFKKRTTKVHDAIPELKDQEKARLRWLTDTTIEVTGTLETTKKPWKSTYTCP